MTQPRYLQIKNEILHQLQTGELQLVQDLVFDLQKRLPQISADFHICLYKYLRESASRGKLAATMVNV